MTVLTMAYHSVVINEDSAARDPRIIYHSYGIQ